MSVIVTDMKMPISCCWCDFGERWDNASTYCRRYPTEPPTKDGEKRPEFCPLKEVTTETAQS